VFAPVVMAGNYPKLPDDTKSRCLRILLMPDLDGTVEDSDWELIEDDALELAARIQVFATTVRGDIRGLKVDLPDGCISRMKEKWRPLKRVAVMAGGRWPDVCDKLIRESVAELAAEREAGLRNLPPGMVLLRDLHEVWDDSLFKDGDLVPTKDLVSNLILHNPEYWGAESSYGKPLTETRFGKLVAAATRETSRRPGGRGGRGFYRRQFEPSWRRLGITNTPVQPGAPGYPGAPGATDKTGKCACGNPLPSMEARNLGKCRPCRDKGKPAA